MVRAEGRDEGPLVLVHLGLVGGRGVVAVGGVLGQRSRDHPGPLRRQRRISGNRGPFRSGDRVGAPGGLRPSVRSGRSSTTGRPRDQDSGGNTDVFPLSQGGDEGLGRRTQVRPRGDHRPRLPRSTGPLPRSVESWRRRRPTESPPAVRPG